MSHAEGPDHEDESELRDILFCHKCGASLFWDPSGNDSDSVAAGTAEPAAEP